MTTQWFHASNTASGKPGKGMYVLRVPDSILGECYYTDDECYSGEEIAMLGTLTPIARIEVPLRYLMAVEKEARFLDSHPAGATY